jgi:hypothetical protein
MAALVEQDKFAGASAIGDKRITDHSPAERAKAEQADQIFHLWRKRKELQDARISDSVTDEQLPLLKKETKKCLVKNSL